MITKGKTTIRLSSVAMVMRVGISIKIQDRYMSVTLSLDIMFVKKNSFLIKISINLKFITSKFITNRIQEGILAATKQIKNIYSNRGFCITE